MTANLDFSNVDRALDAAFRETMFLLGREFTKSITDNVWQWPNPPSPRNIIDSGRLRSCQQLTFQGTGKATFAWPVDYSFYVHQGYTMPDGTTIPGRPWTTHALARFNVTRTVGIIVQRRLGSNG
ncbi:hypothetical protein VF14_03130 [Nostoc linckia z18]|jgi:hypothetical protein|uniref:Uncharacterized protein n=2 Tax=Nostoc linckia TaxID=92942 RepID=A0A9Q5ZH44_NOSLI|nr:hypothetical protein [Nostoc linckia]PHK42373.1 hypothetical protein VF12_03145 [Nostoc linckia z15]PHK46814.1 hypothetical protein VF13_09015 [Nostoc linckia z16]PHJ69143.1 hypothetical protein VF02_00600 [Nostoc linckia z1]PHJ73294.1 hypothetical protein VF05_01615 [Nostoc linckia z3]PHJ78641.1 hypothetical protein VF03_00600 [Nostoc linckia z2]